MVISLGVTTHTGRRTGLVGLHTEQPNYHCQKIAIKQEQHHHTFNTWSKGGITLRHLQSAQLSRKVYL